MNTAYNAFQPVQIWPVPPVFNRDLENNIQDVPHLYPKSTPDIHESFVFEIPNVQDRDWPRFEFVSPQRFDLSLKSVVMWAQTKGKRFTGCDPNAKGDNQGFELIATVERFYVREPSTLEVVTMDTTQNWRDLWLSLNTTETRQVGGNGFGFGFYADGRGYAFSMFYTDTQNMGHNAGIDFDAELPIGEDVIVGTGEPPLIYPGGYSRSDCARLQILFVGNDL